MVIEDLKRNKCHGSVLASFYCDYKFDEKTQTDYILRSLLEQLLHSFDGSFSQVPPALHDILADFSRVRSVDEIPLTKVIIKLATSCKDVIIVIDALDECQDRRCTLDLLRQLPSSVHLFVTSRKENDIELSFQSHSQIRIQEIRPNDIKRDVRKYTIRTLREHLHQYPSFVQDTNLKHIIIETLVENANGM